MRTPPEAFELIREFEGLRLTSYYCPAGKLTIGYGSTRQPIFEEMVISEEEADMRLAQDVAELEKSIINLIGLYAHGLSHNQVGALTSFVYNIGLGAFESSTMLKLLRMGAWMDAANEFQRWVNVHGVELPGLKARRSAERALFSRPDGK